VLSKLYSGRAEVIGFEAPGDFEGIEVGDGDLIKGRVMGVAEVAPIGVPIPVFSSCLRRGGQGGGKQNGKRDRDAENAEPHKYSSSNGSLVYAAREKSLRDGLAGLSAATETVALSKLPALQIRRLNIRLAAQFLFNKVTLQNRFSSKCEARDDLAASRLGTSGRSHAPLEPVHVAETC
jgi:hypothetical protein